MRKTLKPVKPKKRAVKKKDKKNQGVGGPAGSYLTNRKTKENRLKMTEPPTLKKRKKKKKGGGK